jgi:hypothetical protein
VAQRQKITESSKRLHRKARSGPEDGFRIGSAGGWLHPGQYRGPGQRFRKKIGKYANILAKRGSNIGPQGGTIEVTDLISVYGTKVEIHGALNQRR